EKSRFARRSSLIDTWLTATSKSLAPGAMIWSKLAVTHSTWSGANPSSSATAYATAASKPSPAVGSLATTHGSYAGSDVANVRTPCVTVGSAPSAAVAASVVSSTGANAASARAVTTARAVRRAVRMGSPEGRAGEGATPSGRGK